MRIKTIDGCTRVIGEAQGYLGLPLRDILINDSVTGADTPAMESEWELDAVERAQVANGTSLILCVVGRGHPPVMLRVADAEATPPSPASEDQIEQMVQRFLSWRLPENFAPDGGISFQKVGNEGTTFEYLRQPTGTNLLDYQQARQLVTHLLGSGESVAGPAPPAPSPFDDRQLSGTNRSYEDMLP